jgi:hypothetical protein
MDRRDFLVSILQALFLALFPWLRTERGADVLRAALDQAVPTGRAIFKGGSFHLTIRLNGFDVTPELRRTLSMVDLSDANYEVAS